MSEINEIYARKINTALPGAISMLDREPMSKTYGCADRLFWSWKFIDFPGARFQEIAFTLSHLIDKPELVADLGFDGNTLVTWTNAVINYWTMLQSRDGSFDEAYPFERSLAATAFTGFYVGQAFRKISEKGAVQDKNSSQTMSAFQKLGNWLCCNDESHGVLSNHLAAAAAALHTVYEITGENIYKQRCDYFVKKVLDSQSKEGWYEEYGGADVGYQTHTTFYLAHIWRETRCPTLLDSLQRSTTYFSYFVHPDGSMGGEYGSRNTRFYMPAGYDILASHDPTAASISRFMSRSIENNLCVNLSQMDPQNLFPFLNNYLYSSIYAPKNVKSKRDVLPHEVVLEKEFIESGHVVVSTEKYYAILSSSKGGVVFACAKDKDRVSHLYDGGVVIERADGRVLSSQGLNCGHISNKANKAVEITVDMVEMNQVVQSSAKFIGLRILAIFSVFSPKVSYCIKKILVRLLISKRKVHPIKNIREISWCEDGIAIRDTIRMGKRTKLARIFCGGRFSSIHMGSSRYFEWQEFKGTNSPQSLPASALLTLMEKRSLVMKRLWKV